MTGGPYTQEMRTVEADSPYSVRYIRVSCSAQTLVVLYTLAGAVASSSRIGLLVSARSWNTDPVLTSRKRRHDLVRAISSRLAVAPTLPATASSGAGRA